MQEQQSRWGGGCLTLTQIGMIKQVCRGWAIAKSRTRIGEITSVPSIASPQFLRLRDLCDPDFARSKLSYRAKRSRRLCRILTFSLHCLQFINLTSASAITSSDSNSYASLFLLLELMLKVRLLCTGAELNLRDSLG